MKRKQVKEILIFQAKRRQNICIFSLSIAITFLITIIFLIVFIKGNEYHYVKYKEKNNTNYKVYLKENEFFDNKFLEKDNEYISNIIDKIDADFEYYLSLEANVSYSYSYYIESNVNIKRKNSSEYLYNKTEIILDKVEKSTTDNEVKIKKLIEIDYNTHNNLMKKFVNVYSLDEIESFLILNMHVKVLGACDDFSETAQKESVLSIKIPLTTRVVNVELSDNLMNNENNLIECKKMIENAHIFLILAIVSLTAGVVLIYITIRYIVRTRTAETIYQKEMKKILNNYGSYIQTLTNSFDFENYQMLHIHSFNDMLEISDTIRQPILMKENEEKTGAYFLIMANFKVIYIYRLKVSTIEKEIKNQ